MLIVWGPGIKGYTYLNSSVSISGALYSFNRLAALFVAVGVSAGFYIFISSTRPGKAIRAAAEDPTMANVVGVNIDQVLSICFGLGTMLAGLAGVLISMMFQLQAARSLEYTIIAIVVVVFGGLGSITGSLIGGFALGLVISIVNFYDPSLSLIAFYAIFMLLLIVKPSGILGRQVNGTHYKPSGETIFPGIVCGGHYFVIPGSRLRGTVYRHLHDYDFTVCDSDAQLDDFLRPYSLYLAGWGEGVEGLACLLWGMIIPYCWLWELAV